MDGDPCVSLERYCPVRRGTGGIQIGHHRAVYLNVDVAVNPVTGGESEIPCERNEQLPIP